MTLSQESERQRQRGGGEKERESRGQCEQGRRKVPLRAPRTRKWLGAVWAVPASDFGWSREAGRVQPTAVPDQTACG